MAATTCCERDPAPTRAEIVDLLSGHLCRCTGYAPIVDAIAGVRDVDPRREPRVNLARSLLAACERASASVEAFPGSRYGELLPRVRRLAGGLPTRREPGDRVAVVLDNRLETALLYWACQWLGAVFVPLSWRALGGGARATASTDCGAARRAPGDGDALPDGDDEHPGALDRDERELSLLLYTSGTTGRPKGVPRSHRADRAGGLVAGAPARLRLRRPHARRDAALPHDGDPLARRDAPRRRLLRPAAAVGREARRSRLIERERITSLYLAPTLFHDLVNHPGLGRRDVSSVARARVCGRAR